MISTAFFWQLYQISETLSNSRKHRIASSYRFYVISELVYRQSHIHYAVYVCVLHCLNIGRISNYLPFVNK